jgi:hypothetical protein
LSRRRRRLSPSSSISSLHHRRGQVQVLLLPSILNNQSIINQSSQQEEEPTSLLATLIQSLKWIPKSKSETKIAGKRVDSMLHAQYSSLVWFSFRCISATLVMSTTLNAAEMRPSLFLLGRVLVESGGAKY